MPSFQVRRGSHIQRGMETGQSHDGSNEAKYSASRGYDSDWQNSETFWSMIDLIALFPEKRPGGALKTKEDNDHSKFEYITPSTYEYGVDDGGLSTWSLAQIIAWAAGYDIDLTGLTTREEIANAIAAAVDA